MKLEILQADKIAAMKAKDEIKKRVLTDMIDAVQKASITNKGRVTITDVLVDEVLIKYQKTVQEMIDTCPKERKEKLAQYEADMEIVKAYAPQLITDATELQTIIEMKVAAAGIPVCKKSRGAIMKLVSSELRGKADMKTASVVVEMMINAAEA